MLKKRGESRTKNVLTVVIVLVVLSFLLMITAKISPENQTNKITGLTAVDAGEPIPMTLTAKFPDDKDIDPEAVTFLVDIDGEWEIIPTTKIGDKAVAYIEDARKYQNKEGKLMVGLYGTICDSCKETTFTKEYDGGSKIGVILVHGFLSSPQTYDELITYFKITKQPFQVWTYGYPSKQSYEEITQALEKYLELNNKEFDEIKIVAHSLGGLIVQDVLWKAHKENKRFVKKVKQVILIGTPNLGSNIDMNNLKKILLNSPIASRVLGINPELVQIAAKGKTIPRIPGIEYDVIAGTEPYRLSIGAKFLQQTASLNESNDGIVTVDSAQTIGGQEVNNRCYNYYDPKLSHTELLHVEPAWKIIGRLLTKEYHEKEPEKVWLGYNKFLVVENAQPGQTYEALLEKIDEKETSAPLLCNCGNNVCGEGETAENCPIDCMQGFFAAKNNTCGFAQTITILLMLLAFILIIAKGTNKIFYVTMTAAILGILLTIASCGKLPLILTGIWTLLLITKIIPKGKLPPELEFKTGLIEAEERLLKDKDIQKIYDKLLKIYSQLTEKDKKTAYNALLSLVTQETTPKKEKIIQNIEKITESISKEKMTKKEKKIVYNRLKHMGRYSEKIGKIVERLRR